MVIKFVDLSNIYNLPKNKSLYITRRKNCSQKTPKTRHFLNKISNFINSLDDSFTIWVTKNNFGIKIHQLKKSFEKIDWNLVTLWLFEKGSFLDLQGQLSRDLSNQLSFFSTFLCYLGYKLWENTKNRFFGQKCLKFPTVHLLNFMVISNAWH